MAITSICYILLNIPGFLHDLQVPLIVIKLYKPHKKLVIPNREHIKTIIFLFYSGEESLL